MMLNFSAIPKKIFVTAEVAGRKDFELLETTEQNEITKFPESFRGVCPSYDELYRFVSCTSHVDVIDF